MLRFGVNLPASLTHLTHDARGFYRKVKTCLLVLRCIYTKDNPSPYNRCNQISYIQMCIYIISNYKLLKQLKIVFNLLMNSLSLIFLFLVADFYFLRLASLNFSPFSVSFFFSFSHCRRCCSLPLPLFFYLYHISCFLSSFLLSLFFHAHFLLSTE